jgi:hypothetical protein
VARTPVPEKEARFVYLLSGGVCAFPGCNRHLIEPGNSADDPTYLGEIAHIIADSRQGPRGISPLTDEERDRQDNLILLCRDCHKIIDSQPHTYSVSALGQMKADHEGRIRRATAARAIEPRPSYKQEIIHSSLLAVTNLPAAVFAAPCAFRDRQEHQVQLRIRYPEGDEQLVRFLLREGKLYTFHNLNDPKGPFADVIDRRSVEPLRATDLWREPEGLRRYIGLLNKALFKYTARLNVRFDPGHRRFYFPVLNGEERVVTYRPLNLSTATRKVAWQPQKRTTGEKRNFWWHLAASLKFHWMGGTQWCLSIRPERHLTTNGTDPLPSKQVGRRVTSNKARMYNDLYLGEVNFWRDFLSQGSPRFVLNFGDQCAVVDTQFTAFDVNWPGIPGDDKPFKNQVYEDDLFTYSALASAVDGEAFDYEEADDGDPEEEGEDL